MKDYEKAGQDFLKKYGIKFVYRELGVVESPWKEDGADMFGFGVKFYLKGATNMKVAFKFYHGLGIKGPPTPYSVLSCIRSDFYSVENARSMDDFLDELGYTGSIKAVRDGERAWKKTNRMMQDFKDNFGDEVYQALLDTEDLS